MTALAPADLEFERRARNTEKQRRWREARRPPIRTKRVNCGVGEPIAEGRWAVDDFEKCERKWSALMAGARFTDEVAPRF